MTDGFLHIPLQRPLPVLRHVEARLVSLGFHTAGIAHDPGQGAIGQDVILVRPDRLFCLCCGTPISLEQFMFCMGCGRCDVGGCQKDAAEFLKNHNWLARCMAEVVDPYVGVSIGMTLP